MSAVIGGLCAGLFLPSPGGAEPKAVIELYTSQGCSSCPPADALAAQYAQNKDLIVLTLPVTYWDYLGWKDTFAKSQFTERQYNYAKRFRDRSVYTPQVVINGEHREVGSYKSKIDRYLETTSLKLDVEIEVDGENLAISLPQAPSNREAVIWLALLQEKADVKIARGENRNRQLVYTNVVREMRPIGTWYGKAMRVDLPKENVMGDNLNGVAIVVQEKVDGLPGKILGADLWMEKPSS